MTRRQHATTPPTRTDAPSRRVYVYQPAGADLWEGMGPATGTRVVLVQPRGCPRNGTLGHAYLADADSGQFYGLRLLTSLQPAADRTEPRP